MCGRYLLKTALEELARIFGFTERPNSMPRYNIAPTLEVPVIRQRREPAGQRSIAAYAGAWSCRGRTIPSRAAADQRAGRDAAGEARLPRCRAEAALSRSRRRLLSMERGRCVEAAYLIARRDRAPFAFAGLWERWGPRHDPAAALDSFTIITADANDFLSGFITACRWC